MLSIILKLLLVAVAAILSYAYFSTVLPPTAAVIIAAIIAAAELAGAVLLGGGTHGGGLRLLMKIGLPLLLWPGIAWLLERVTGLDRFVSLAIASGLASALGVLGAGRGWGHENARLAAMAMSAALPLYTLILAILGNASDIGMACSVGAVAIAPLVVRGAGAWPGAHERVLRDAGAACAAVAVVWVALNFL